MTSPFDAIPHVDFVPKTTDEIIAEMVGNYEEEYYRLTGEPKTVLPSSEERLLIYTQAYQFYIAYQLIDRGLKMNLLKYSEKDYLENLAALFGLERLPAQPSVSRIRFTLSQAQPQDIHIPKGTRVATSDRIYFRTRDEAVIPSGESSVEVDIESEEGGAFTTGLQPGQIRVLVNPIPFVAEAVNTLSSQGGIDKEDDDSLRLRIYYMRDSYSVAGPERAYRYFVRSYSQAIEGIGIYSPEPGVVDICLTLTGGELPEQPFLDKLMEYLEDKRPLTDRLILAAPDVVTYALECTYYIGKSNINKQGEIRAQVEAAIETYLQWQGQEIGRDISPDMLTKLVIQANAKRVPIISPQFTLIDHKSIPKHTSVNVIYGGVEDD